ncbi:ClpP/crotonase-like domain-containing protein [Plectosphaerella cucumerina]|uniref:ClpP/crotonase-like domain-containing protein n=1 Tax=Plectosphaerella cucumerina TaxID=40658 RepID=A0A8K0X6L3_9PEZI|nr:ClpP/crotonase-like domain-containing protein [Plectosphaerella cucumerina]
MTKTQEWQRDTVLQDSPSPEYRISRRGPVVKIELTRPKSRNSLTSDLVSGLKDAYTRIARDSSIFRIYLTGQGRVFCAGMNLSPSNSTPPPGEDTHRAQLAEFRGLLQAIEDAPQVTVALINGPCYGGGNGLAFANDIRISVRDATFNLTEVKLGLAPCAISPVLAREWGLALCRSAMLTARPVTAEELRAVGAIYALADDGKHLQGDAMEELEKRLRASAPGASTVCKELIHVAWTDPGGKEQDEVVAKRYVEMMTPSKEARHGIQQFKKGVREVDWEKFWDAELGKSRL